MNHHIIKFFSEIHLGSLVLRDPVTGITNLMIFAAGLLGWKQVKSSAATWSRFFLFIGLSSLIGVIVHTFSNYTPAPVHFWIWITMGLVQNIGISCAQAGTVLRYSGKYKKLLLALIVLQYLVSAIAVIWSGEYKAVKWHVAAGMLPVMGWYFHRWAKGEKTARWIALGIAVSGITVAVHSFKISLNEAWFNYNDIAHLLIVASLLLMAKGFSGKDPGQA